VSFSVTEVVSFQVTGVDCPTAIARLDTPSFRQSVADGCAEGTGADASADLVDTDFTCTTDSSGGRRLLVSTVAATVTIYGLSSSQANSVRRDCCVHPFSCGV
jgi:hypothetical protein